MRRILPANSSASARRCTRCRAGYVQPQGGRSSSTRPGRQRTVMHTSSRLIAAASPASSPRLAARLEASGSKIAILDLAQIGERDDSGGDPGRWYYNVAYRILRQLRIQLRPADLVARQVNPEQSGSGCSSSTPRSCSSSSPSTDCQSSLMRSSASRGPVAYADQLLASIRAAHNARTTDPDFARLTFVLLGECDPVNLDRRAGALAIQRDAAGRTRRFLA